MSPMKNNGKCGCAGRAGGEYSRPERMKGKMPMPMEKTKGKGKGKKGKK